MANKTLLIFFSLAEFKEQFSFLLNLIIPIIMTKNAKNLNVMAPIPIDPSS